MFKTVIVIKALQKISGNNEIIKALAGAFKNREVDFVPVIKVEKLTKVFGKRPKEALKLLEEGYSKDEILKKTGNTVGG